MLLESCAPSLLERPHDVGHKRSSSYAQRQAGTAQWVFDRANSADAGAYIVAHS